MQPGGEGRAEGVQRRRRAVRQALSILMARDEERCRILNGKSARRPER